MVVAYCILTVTFLHFLCCHALVGFEEDIWETKVADEGVTIFGRNVSTCMVAKNWTQPNGLLQGTITSYVDPATKRYLPHQICLAIIGVRLGSRMVIDFNWKTMKMESCGRACFCDRIGIGVNWQTAVVVSESSFCYDRPVLTPPLYLRVYWKWVFVRFTTDADNEPGEGFELQWREERPANACSAIVTISDDVGSINAPVYDNGTSVAYQQCIWTFPGYGKNIVWQFSFESIKINNLQTICSSTSPTCYSCNDGSIKITDYVVGFGKVPNILTTRCGAEIPVMKFTSISNRDVEVKFRSDGLHKAYKQMLGNYFKINYVKLPLPCMSTILLSGESGVAKPYINQFTGQYSPNQDCVWIISAPPGKTLLLTLSRYDFDCKNSSLQPLPKSCDVLEIHDGSDVEKPIMAKINGRNQTNETMTFLTSGPRATLHFVTGTYYEATGFEVYFQAIEGDLSPCREMLTILANNATGGQLSNYRRTADGFYRSGEDCRWQLMAPSDQRIVINITQLDIDSCGAPGFCLCDSLTIFDGRDTSARTLSVICGTNQTSSQQERSFITTLSDAFVIFRTDSVQSNASGFELTYYTIENNELISVDEDNKQVRQVVAVVSAVVGALSLFVMIATTVIVARKRRADKKHAEELRRKLESMDLGMYVVPADNFQDLLIEMGSAKLTEEVEKLSIRQSDLCFFGEQRDKVVGIGSSGVVVSAILASNGCRVAVKSLKACKAEQLVQLIREAITMSQLDHKNVMKLTGIAIIDQIPHVVMPLADNGNLKEYLSTLEVIPNLGHLHSFCQQICCGMAYIHQQGFVHFDLAARNVLLTGDLVAKIADFGMARYLDSSGYYKWMGHDGKAIPIRWHPPESIVMNFFDMKSDVWSFGVVCWEIFSLCKSMPYEGLKNDQIVAFLKAGNRLSKPLHCSEDFYRDVLLPCWRYSRFERPMFDALKKSAFVDDEIL